MYPAYYLSLAFLFQHIGISDNLIPLMVTVTLWVISVASAGLLYWVLSRPVGRLLHYAANKTDTKWDDYILVPPVFKAIAGIAFSITLSRLLPLSSLYYPQYHHTLMVVLKILVIFSVARGVNVGVNVVYDACNKQNVDIHGLAVLRNIINSITYCVATLITVSILLDRDVVYILSGLGAMAAVLSLVFRDTILSMVAGVKLSADKSLKIGDWIQVPSCAANGEVIDLTLSTVKVRNFDNSIVCVPPYMLVQGGFQNHEEMKRTGGRRIMRSINIDITSVRYLSPGEMKEFAAEEWAADLNLQKPCVNLTLFRRYLQSAILDCNGFRNDMLNMVRELQPTAEGIPLEIYLFTTNTDWKLYEYTQADLLDSVVASLPRFGLRLFQHPTGTDIVRVRTLSAD